MNPAAPVTRTRMSAAKHEITAGRPPCRYRHTFVRADRSFSCRAGPAAPVLSGAMEIDVVLPCLNEADALPWVLSRMPLGYRPIVADNGSTDDSAAIARGVLRGAGRPPPATGLRGRLPRGPARGEQ